MIRAAIQVHRTLGRGLLERAYALCLARELVLRGHQVETEVAVPLRYRGIHLDVCFRADIIVNGQVLVEVKAVESLVREHRNQAATYLRLGGWPVGLVLNFHARTLREGLQRVVY